MSMLLYIVIILNFICIVALTIYLVSKPRTKKIKKWEFKTIEDDPLYREALLELDEYLKEK